MDREHEDKTPPPTNDATDVVPDEPLELMGNEPPTDPRVPPASSEPPRPDADPRDDDMVILRDAVDHFPIDEEWTPVPPPKRESQILEPEPEPIPEPESAPEPEPPVDPNETRREELLGVDWEGELSGKPKSRTPTTEIPRPSATMRAPRRRVGLSKAESWGLRIAMGVGVVATVLMALRIEPFHTWYYLFAWYPFLLGINVLASSVSYEHSLFRRPRRPIVSMLLWSVPVWLFFEIWNFRLQDWYYVGVPANVVARQIGVVLSFATVLPGLCLLEEALDVRRVFRKLQTPVFPVGRKLEKALLWTGAAWAALLLALPTIFFPLLWGVPVLLLEPWLHRGGGPSLLRDLSEGRVGRTLRLLVAGMVCGLFWESANYFAGGKWVYTVPGFEASKVFEMPLLGFVGFAPFALSIWTIAQALVRLGVLPDWTVTKSRPAGRKRRRFRARRRRRPSSDRRVVEGRGPPSRSCRSSFSKGWTGSRSTPELRASRTFRDSPTGSRSMPRSGEFTACVAC